VSKKTIEPDKQNDETEDNDPLNQLRHLILHAEQEKIAELEQRLNNKSILTDEISQILPAAIKQSNAESEQLSNALMPTVETAVKKSVMNDTSIFTDVLYPVMGPAIRRSISEAFKDMLQSLNAALENSFSRQGIQWRLESIRTGKSFSEIALLRSLDYRVEQVFLIHSETGTLLQHVHINMENFQDADMVSSMLTAITDFVKDSFAVEGHSILDSIQIDDLTVLIEPGPLAILAVAIRGIPPTNMREVLRQALEHIHQEQSLVLSQFSGDSSAFEESRSDLESCLKVQYKEKTPQEQEKKFLFYIAAIFIAIILACSWGAFNNYQHTLNWNAYIERLKQEPGIVITDTHEEKGQTIITGLRDPLAKKPQALREQFALISKDDISYHLQPYQALIPQFILQRSALALDKPEQVTLSLANGVLSATGIASYTWQQETRKMAPFIAGVIAYNDVGLSNIDLNLLKAPKTVIFSLNRGILSAKGSAPQQWILDTRKKLKLNQNIKAYNDNSLVSIEKTQIDSIIDHLQQIIIVFQAGTANQSILPLETYRCVDKIKQLIALAKILKKHIIIHILGHTDISGRYTNNLKLSQERAKLIYRYFIEKGISKQYIKVLGEASNIPVGNDPSGVDKKLNRSVTFHVEQINPS